MNATGVGHVHALLVYLAATWSWDLGPAHKAIYSPACVADPPDEARCCIARLRELLVRACQCFASANTRTQRHAQIRHICHRR